MREDCRDEGKTKELLDERVAGIDRDMVAYSRTEENIVMGNNIPGGLATSM